MKNNGEINELPAPDNCTGCSACSNVCPQNAISMMLSSDGFNIPVIDENTCVNCGMCVRYCPIASTIHNDNYSEKQITAYAAHINNDSLRLQSSSGGFFSAVAEYILEQGGIVFGAAWDENLNVRHIGAENPAELQLLMSSKYQQSIIGDTYKQIAAILANSDRKVLFTGTPCQVAAMKNFSDSENLLTIDLVCHGVPSKTVFEEYIRYIAKGQKVQSYTFRDKSTGWSNYKVKMHMEGKQTYECITRDDPFFHGFICDLYSNLPCYNCKFCSIPRTGDITMGDFWKIPAELMDEKGVSVLLANNKKGLRMLAALSHLGRIKIHSKPLTDALPGNPRIKSGRLPMRADRQIILSKISSVGFETIMENYIKKTQRYVY